MLGIIPYARSCVKSDIDEGHYRNPKIERLNIAGNRESKNPGIGARVERFLMAVFERVNESPAPSIS